MGQRILVIGNSCSGKSTLGAALAAHLAMPFVELDAINWQPNWVGLNEADPEEFIRRIQEATAGDGWVVAGSYTKFSQQAFWPRLETIVWLDLPRHLLVWRLLKRSWQRWRSKELLWGTNYERFWPQLMFWRKQDSLLWWILSQHASKKQKMLRYQASSRWQHIRFVRLCSRNEVEAFVKAFDRAATD